MEYLDIKFEQDLPFIYTSFNEEKSVMDIWEDLTVRRVSNVNTRHMDFNLVMETHDGISHSGTDKMSSSWGCYN